MKNPEVWRLIGDYEPSLTFVQRFQWNGAHYGGITLILAPNRVAEELETIAKKAHFTVWLLYKQNYCKGHQGNLFLQHKYNLDNREVTGRSLCGFDIETWSKIAEVKTTLEQKAVTPHSGNKWSYLRILLKTECKGHKLLHCGLNEKPNFLEAAQHADICLEIERHFAGREWPLREMWIISHTSIHAIACVLWIGS